MPYRWFINMAIFRENSDDSYVGIEFEAESDKAKKLNQFLQDELGVKKNRASDIYYSL